MNTGVISSSTSATPSSSRADNPTQPRTIAASVSLLQRLGMDQNQAFSLLRSKTNQYRQTMPTSDVERTIMYALSDIIQSRGYNSEIANNLIRSHMAAQNTAAKDGEEDDDDDDDDEEEEEE